MTDGLERLGVDFPRDFAAIAPAILPVTVSVVPSLTTRKMQAILFSIIRRPSSNIRDRRLRGCLVAHRGHGMVFLDEDDDAAVRFAAAHELAHFVGHYLLRREMVLARLGPTINDVLDGRREATPGERMGGIIKGAPIGVFADFMDREHGQPVSPAAEAMEYEADHAAFLALAPLGAVIARAMADGPPTRASVVHSLIEAFGLSPSDAERHAPQVLGAVARRRPTFTDGLRAAASSKGRERQR